MRKPIFNLPLLAAIHGLLPCGTHAQEVPKPLQVASLVYQYAGPAATYTIPAGGQYSWGSKERVIYALEDTVQKQLAAAVRLGIEKRWGQRPALPAVEVKEALNMWGEVPRFKPKANRLAKGQIHLFIRITDFGPAGVDNMPLAGFSQPYNGLALTWKLEAKAIDGDTGAEIITQEMVANVRHQDLPAGCQRLYRAPCTQPAFAGALHAAITRLFEEGKASSYLELTVPPACLLIPDSIPVLRSLHFSMQGRQLQNQEEQNWRWTMEEPRFENAGLKLKMGKNAVGGLFTMLTGVGTDKVTETQYNALVNIYDVASQTAYRFTVPYILEEREDRERTRTRQADGTRLTSTETTGQVRSNFTIDGNRPGYLLANADTIARFNLRFSLRVPVAQPDAYWDGTDSSTLTNLPKHWGNQGLKMPFQITGQLQGKYFEANSMYDEEVLDLNFDKKLVARVRTTQNRPVHALIYEELPIELWKPLFYFASLPLGQGR